MQFNINCIKSYHIFPLKTVLNVTGWAVKIANHYFQLSLQLLRLPKMSNFCGKSDGSGNLPKTVANSVYL